MMVSLEVAVRLVLIATPILLVLDFASYMTVERPFFFPSKNLSLLRAIAFLLSFFVIAIVLDRGLRDLWNYEEATQTLGYYGSLALHGYGLHLFIRRQKWIAKRDELFPSKRNISRV